MSAILAKIRPNILLAMVLIGTLGITISYLGYRMLNEGIISAAGVGAIMALSNLSGKILEKE